MKSAADAAQIGYDSAGDKNDDDSTAAKLGNRLVNFRVRHIVLSDCPVEIQSKYQEFHCFSQSPVDRQMKAVNVPVASPHNLLRLLYWTAKQRGALSPGAQACAIWRPFRRLWRPSFGLRMLQSADADNGDSQGEPGHAALLIGSKWRRSFVIARCLI
jgi:hypothetical protein